MKETLKDLRVQAKMTCKKVSQVLGVTEQAFYRYEKGERRISLEQVLTLAELYDCTEKEIIQAQLNSHRTDR